MEATIGNDGDEREDTRGELPFKSRETTFRHSLLDKRLPGGRPCQSPATSSTESGEALASGSEIWHGVGKLRRLGTLWTETDSGDSAGRHDVDKCSEKCERLRYMAQNHVDDPEADKAVTPKATMQSEKAELFPAGEAGAAPRGVPSERFGWSPFRFETRLE